MSDEAKPQKTSNRHTFPKGKNWNGNANGRPVAPEIEELRTALRMVRKHHKNKPLLVHAIERAYINDKVLIAILKKIIPDKVSAHLEGEIKGGETKVIIVRAERKEDGERIQADIKTGRSLRIPE